jgi:polysaccharide export outer membrane protein
LRAGTTNIQINHMTIVARKKSLEEFRQAGQRGVRRRPLKICLLGCLGLLLAVTGCQTAQSEAPAAAAPAQPEALTVRAGDVLKISFPGAPTLDTQQQVRRDGRISLSIIGELTVTGMTPAELEKELITRYSAQLVSKEVLVTVISSSFDIFVTGAVLKPGKITSDHAMSALEAVMEAGGFDNAKANTKRVVVIRNEEGKTKNYQLDLQKVIDGKSNEPFILKPSDIVVVPEKTSWF